MSSIFSASLRAALSRTSIVANASARSLTQQSSVSSRLIQSSQFNIVKSGQAQRFFTVQAASATATPSVSIATPVPPVAPVAAANINIETAKKESAPSPENDLKSASDAVASDTVASSYSAVDQQQQDRKPRRPMRPREKASEWNCSSCNAPNKAWAAICSSCSVPRPGYFAKQGDFICVECSEHNYASRSNCRACGVDRPAEAGTPKPFTKKADQSTPYENRQFRSPRSTGRSFQPDWKCPACGGRVFGHRDTCFKESCGAAKPENPEVFTEPRPPRPNNSEFGMRSFDRRGSGDRQGYVPRQRGDQDEVQGQPRNNRRMEKREGDWGCPSCGEVNFAFRFECRKCNAAKPSN